MKSFFKYDLPIERIAQHHAGLSAQRSSSKLLHAKITAGSELEIVDRVFSDFSQLVSSDDLLILNNTKVLPFRFFARNQRSGAEIEILLLQCIDRQQQIWEGVGKPLRKLLSGDVLTLSVNLVATVLGRSEDQRKVNLRIESVKGDAELDPYLVSDGLMPIPPYIRKGRAEDEDRELYQTVYATEPGSIAAPTAGLHFTEQILEQLRAKGVGVEFITLNVGLASFTKVESEDLKGVTVPTEYFSIPSELQQKISDHKSQGKRVIAVGTTTTRALESWARFSREGVDCSQQTATDLFLTPGDNFEIVDALVTNFHQPQTTHLLLVSAFIGGEVTEQIYSHALAGDYRFLSYGDSMFLERSQKR